MVRNKIRRVLACTDRGGVTFNTIFNCHSYLSPPFYIETYMLINKCVHSDFPNTMYTYNCFKIASKQPLIETKFLINA